MLILPARIAPKDTAGLRCAPLTCPIMMATLVMVKPTPSPIRITFAAINEEGIYFMMIYIVGDAELCHTNIWAMQKVCHSPRGRVLG